MDTEARTLLRPPRPFDRAPLTLIVLFSLLNFVLALTSLVAQQGQRQAFPESILERVLRTRLLRVAAPADYAPFALARCDGSGVAGSDIEEMTSLAQSLDASVVISRVPWSDLVREDPSARLRFDVAVGGIDDTLDRRRHVDYSNVRP